MAHPRQRLEVLMVFRPLAPRSHDTEECGKFAEIKEVGSGRSPRFRLR